MEWARVDAMQRKEGKQGAITARSLPPFIDCRSRGLSAHAAAYETAQSGW